jgi:hypothetical protein
MWLSPWDNDVRGGNQLAHAIWAFSTGGPFGSGPGWGDTEMIPAGNTDLVLPAIGEEWGAVGVATVFLLFGFLVARGFRAAVRADTHFGFFLGLGLSTLLSSEMLLISSGVLGVLPLSGVVSPFLSSGNTAMLANFLIFALLASISARGSRSPQPGLLPASARPLQFVLAGAAAVLLVFAVRYQVVADAAYLARDARTYEEDGVKRAQRNPRMNSLAREIPRGSIYDRNGVPLATSDWDELLRHQAEYAALGISPDAAASRFEARHYPFGSATAHLIGDLRTGENFDASNTSLVERDSNARLQGYEYSELAPLVRHRHQPGNPDIARILARDRTVRLTIDIRLQLRAQRILERRLRAAGASNGAVVVMSAVTGDLLAMVSAPAPDPPAARSAAATPDELLDRARYGQYPPGSAFKLVTAIAALVKDPALRYRTFLCRTLADGRAGAIIPGWNRPIKDDIGDRAHGTLDMERAIAVSCNAYFAQLGVHDVGSLALADTAARMGFSTGDPTELRCHSPPTARDRCWLPLLKWPAWRPPLPPEAACRKAAGSAIPVIRAPTLPLLYCPPLRPIFWRAPCGGWSPKGRRARPWPERPSPWPARPAQPNWTWARRTVGSSVLRLTMAMLPAAWPSPSWWSTAVTARAWPRPSPARSWKPREIWVGCHRRRYEPD